MAYSIALIILCGVFFNFIAQKIKLPGLVGMLFAGILIGPYGLNLIDSSMLEASSDIRKIALVVILLRAGLGLELEELKKVGFSAFKLSFMPCVFEGICITFLAHFLLGFTYIEGGMLGFIIAAVSPAVVVPFMIKYKEQGHGKKNAIPTLILAGSSVDDIFAITFFSAFLSFYQNEGGNILQNFIKIPVSISLGIVIGIIIGILVVLLFKRLKTTYVNKGIILLAISIMLSVLENVLKPYVEFSSLLSIMCMGFVISFFYRKLSDKLSPQFSDIWSLAQIFLFVLVGAEVNYNLIFHTGVLGIVLITIGLLARSMGVFSALWGSKLNSSEKAFVSISYIPKATVQAALGAIPLTLGVHNGDIILAVSVLSIILTAPVGAFLMEAFVERLIPE